MPSGDLPVSDAYDFEHALRRVMVLYCGRSPTYDELAEFRDSEVPREQLYQSQHQTLDDCLISDYWRGQGLPRLADPRIRPITALGAQSPVDIVIADYAWDYRLFVYVMTEDRDVRDLLLADYYVTVQPDGTLVPVDGAIDSPAGPDAPGGQPLEPSRRAGMITTQWFLALNTMGTALPRTSAAQAYRAYLGADIALQQGLFPVAGEPVDVDKKGVTERQCALCHSTLDPLSYAFARYEGAPSALGPSGIYNENRPAQWIPDWTDNQGVLFGQPVDSLVAWAVTAAESDAFQRNIVAMLFQHAVERAPTPGEQIEFDAIWKACPRTDGRPIGRFTASWTPTLLELAHERFAIFLVLLGSACGPDGDDDMPMVTPPPPAACEGEAPAPESLQWKRISALENDLMSALDLAREEVCNELGLYRCSLVHLVPLGSANPFGASLYEAVAEPLATTPAAIDRIVLAACVGRVQRDRQATPEVFTHFMLEGPAPAAGAPEVAAMIQDLYRRFLQRDATAEEIAMVAELTVDDAGAPVTAADFAKLACFTVGTTTEFLFF